MKTVYYNMFQEELCRRLKSELHGHFEKAMLLWMRDAAERDAIILRDALQCRSSSKRNEILMQTLCSRDAEELDSIANAYNTSFKGVLQDDIESSITNPCQKLFVLQLQGNRDDQADMETHRAREEATELYNAGEGRSTGLDEAIFIRILTTRNRRQLCSIFDAYETIYGHSIHKGLKEFKGSRATEVEQLVRNVTKYVAQPTKYFAKVLYKSMKGLGTDDDTLIRVVVSRAETDMSDIKTAFLSKYKKALSAMISSDTIGNYKRFLLALIGAAY